MVVQGDPAMLPNGEGIGFGRKFFNAGVSIRGESSARLALKPFISRALRSRTSSAMARLSSAMVKKRRLHSLSRIHLGDQDRLFDFGLVARLVRPRGTNRRAVMIREFEIAAVQARLVAIRVGDGGFPCETIQIRSRRWSSRTR